MSSEVRLPLFDRLVDYTPGVHREPRPMRTLDRAGLRESVRRELQRLFNTRAPLPPRELEQRQRSVIDYGIPDFANYAPGSFEDRQRLAAALRSAVEAYEPRLREARVAVDVVPERGQALRARVSGVLEVDEVTEPVSFLTLFAKELGGVTVEEETGQG